MSPKTYEHVMQQVCTQSTVPQLVEEFESLGFPWLQLVESSPINTTTKASARFAKISLFRAKTCVRPGTAWNLHKGMEEGRPMARTHIFPHCSKLPRHQDLRLYIGPQLGPGPISSLLWPPELEGAQTEWNKELGNGLEKKCLQTCRKLNLNKPSSTL